MESVTVAQESNSNLSLHGELVRLMPTQQGIREQGIKRCGCYSVHQLDIPHHTALDLVAGMSMLIESCGYSDAAVHRDDDTLVVENLKISDHERERETRI